VAAPEGESVALHIHTRFSSGIGYTASVGRSNLSGR
jgi:hypothetical protein